MAKFQRRHYRQFALEVYLRAQAEGMSRAQHMALAQARARELEGTNPHFDYFRFVNACLSGMDKVSRRAHQATVEL